MGSIFIEGLRVSCIIGTNAWEQETPQELLIDIEMRTDISAAAASDDLHQALDYHAVSQRIDALCAANKARLLEVLADKIVTTILAEFNTDHIRLRINKPAAIPTAQATGLIVERSA